MTQDVYIGRKVVNPANADVLQRALDTQSRGWWGVINGVDLGT